jgi:hypothetical protein
MFSDMQELIATFKMLPSRPLVVNGVPLADPALTCSDVCCMTAISIVGVRQANPVNPLNVCPKNGRPNRRLRAILKR